MMPRARLLSLALAATLPLTPLAWAPAQMHRVAKSEPVTRAVAVYEFAGDLKKPTAARLIPVSLFIGGHFEDAGSYLARPIPFALDTGNVYELQKAGEPLGTLDLAYAKNLRGSSAEVTVPFDEAWFGYGRFTPAKAPKLVTAKPGAKSTQHAYPVTDDGKPHFGSKPDDTQTSAPRKRGDTSDVDPAEDRPQRVSLPDDTDSKRDPNAPNPDRPTLRRRPEDTTGGAKGKKQKETASVSQDPVGPDKDPDRPTIKRKGAAAGEDDGIPPDPSEVNSTRSTHGAAGTVSASTNASANGVLADGSRPELRRRTVAANNGPAVTQAAAMPEMAKVVAPGLPPDLHLAVAVSDMKERTPHDYGTPFASEADRAAAMGEMRTLALEVLHTPTLATDAPAFVKTDAAATHAASPSAAAAARTLRTPAARAAAARRAHAAATPVAPTDALTDEQLTAYTLSYGSPLTYVYTAEMGSSPTRFVTVVAQRNLDGKLDISMRSVTDSAHLDRTPRYRLVDAVDADASNRASLLFEVRGQSARQFALYRLLGPKPDEVFVSGTTK